ncbi:cation:proton antiporter [Tomitella biformata]|uniref:cation:proton antiporter n=1 Tax=Tomitella biformata TaxID=630403 RepID=UPI00046467F0|nr:cation:proton antiporter [Tomitella biformata]
MTATVATSLFWIVLVAAAAPLIARALPHRLLPEVVLLLVAGIAIGPFGLGLAVAGSEIELLNELGLGLLFLLAGYELDKTELTGRGGRRAMYTWLLCLGLAFGVVAALNAAGLHLAEIAVAIALTSTALGTLLPILKDRGLTTTRVGKAVLNHGAFGELGPVVAMAILLGARGAFASLLVLAVFALVAVIVGMLPTRLLREGTRLLDLVRGGADSTGQTTMRLTMLLLVSLVTVAAVFDLDVILGAFAAGFILRRLIPDGDHRLESKLEGLGFGFLIPIFFVVSGMAIEVHSVVENPLALLVFLALLIVVRGVPVFLSARFDKREERFSTSGSAQLALYSTTGLPIIVAVTGVAVTAGQMSNASASILVAAGAITVFVLPLIASIVAGRSKSDEPADS